MNVLITGAEGFVGRNLAESLAKTAHAVLYPTRAELDLTNAVAVEAYFRKNPIDTIVHCATTLREVTSYPADTCENNLRMFFNLEKQVTSSMKLIHLGSGSEYDRKHWHRKMPEDYFDEHIPDDSHSYSKYLIAKYIKEIKGKNIVCLRIFGIFGHYEDYRYKFISNAIVKNLLGLPIVISQNVVYDYLCVEDFNRVVEYFLANDARHRVYNITPTDSIDLLTIARHINDVSAKRSEVQVLHEGIGVEYSGDNRLFLSEAVDFRFTPYRDAIEALYRYYQDRVHELDAAAVRQDAYLEYAKRLHDNYFGKQHAQ
jgi:GDP-L-fucose synthase